MRLLVVEDEKYLNEIISKELTVNGYVFVSVKDNDIGMTEDDQRRVLTRFYRSDATYDKSGYGLGLPIALKIAKKHGGTIEVESEVGKGSRFTLYLEKK